MPGCFSQLFYEGTSLTWYGNIPGELSGNATTATWVIDDNPAQNFTLKGHEVNAATVYNQKIFETPVYPLGSHKLTVTYNGDSSKTPLVLGKLVIQNDTAVPSAAVSSVVPSTTGTHTTSSHTPAIVGSVIGGVACLVTILLVLFVLYRRRQKKMKTNAEPASYVLAPQIASYNPARLPAKMSQEHFLQSHGSIARGSGPSVESATHPTTGDGQHSPNPSDSHVSDSTGWSRVGPSSLVVHRDSGTRLPQAMPGLLRDIPPAYTSD